ncbi:MAG: amidohydrolase family protein [Anaerolineales bacterium]|uniref:Amidohydrolase family protein n=1 Tax=Candidatus Desulfolinea nitratireducens TaxID=2841698 RepID=A0A8J6TDX4_9CHLR|nr:amidohydrolase family protein [Candidatus Desulfolinea nitratireducens]
MPEKIDTLITHAHLFTMQGEGVGYIPDGAVAIQGSRICAIGPTSELKTRFEANEIIDASGCAVLPGLIDAHMHTSWAVVRGVAQDVSNWMQAALAPYARHVTPSAALAGTRLNILEAIKAGTTTMGDFSKPYPGWAEAFEGAGVRARLTPTINALPTGGMAGLKIGELYPLDPEVGQQAIDTAIAFIHDWHGAAKGRITTMLGPQAPDMISRDQLLQVKRLAEKENLMLHMHVAQGDREINQMLKRFDQRTPEYLKELGYLDDQLLAVHLTEATDEEAALIARSGARMALCSGSIGIIDGIVPPAYAFREAGGLVALGSDQAAGNNCNNIFNEMKLTALFNKIKARDPEVMPAWEVLRMATIEGAQAIGLGDQIGSLEAGKEADLILVDLSAPNLTPVLETPIRTIVPNLVYGGSGQEVKTVLVAGEIILRDGKAQKIDEAEICSTAQSEAEKVAQRVAVDPIHKNMALLTAMKKGQM